MFSINPRFSTEVLWKRSLSGQAIEEPGSASEH